MRPDTEVVVGIRSVGNRAHEPIIESCDVVSAMKKIALFIANESLSQRFQFVITRTREDALVGLGLSATNQQAKRRENAERISDFIDELFDAPAGAQAAEPESAITAPQGLPTGVKS